MRILTTTLLISENSESLSKISPPDITDTEQFSEQHRQWVQKAISNGEKQRERCWTESIAVGSIGFVEKTKVSLGIKGMGRRIEEQEADRCVLREEMNLMVLFLTP
ncbi:MAG: hypothetical protein HXX11_21950 [Desulfuromonadales bacterium]|nr:hypothetical protein [Desulfuromonadales bacterium]